jgi:membrane protein YqaA with SNARE-associated domain
VGERQPHGADLLPAGRQAVEDPARDDEVRARVVVRQRQAELVVVPGGRRAGERNRERERGRERAGCLQGNPNGLIVYTLAVRRLLDWTMGLAETLGSPGLFLLAFLDSSFLSFPEVVDILMVGLVVRYPERMLWYAALPTIGSVAGAYVIYALARRGGETFIRKRMHERHVDRAFAVFRKYGMLAVAIPSIMPPPVPFKIFMLAAGASGLSRRDFLVAVTLGRSVRYFGEALLAAWYGEAAFRAVETFMHEHTVLMLVVMGGLAAAGAGWIWWSRRRSGV